MSQSEIPRPYHRFVTVLLLLLNLLAVGIIVLQAGAERWDMRLQEHTFLQWLGAAQMFAAALVFLACFFAVRVIPLPNERLRDHAVWPVFSTGFFVLALDQQFRLREAAILGVGHSLPGPGEPSAIFLVLKLAPVVLAVALVFYFRKTVLANFHMMMGFLAGFWFLGCMLLVDTLLESVAGSADMARMLAMTAKLLAMAMFLGASFAALLDRLQAARSAINAGEREIALHVPGEAPRERGMTARQRASVTASQATDPGVDGSTGAADPATGS